MKKTIRRISTLGLIPAFVVLAGCSDGPSNSDVKNILLAEQDKMTRMMNSMSGRDKSHLFPKIDDVQVSGCNETRDNFFECSVEVSVTHMGQSASEVKPAAFAKKKDGSWALVN